MGLQTSKVQHQQTRSLNICLTNPTFLFQDLAKWCVHVCARVNMQVCTHFTAIK